MLIPVKYCFQVTIFAKAMNLPDQTIRRFLVVEQKECQENALFEMENRPTPELKGVQQLVGNYYILAQ
jgi:hypothetical protein